MYNKICILISIIAIISIVGCAPEEIQSEAPSSDSVGSTIENSLVKKTGARQLELTFESVVLANYSLAIINQTINNVFANPNAYTLEKTNIPTRQLKINSVSFAERTQYIINTAESINIGIYSLKLIDPTNESIGTLIETEFEITAADGPFDIDFSDEQGNYYAFTPAVKKHEDGVIISVIDAEIGVPSFYNLKISLPASISSQMNTLKSALDSSGDQANHSITPTSSSESGSQIRIRETMLTGYTPDVIVTGALFPIYDSYEKDIDEVTYENLEVLVYLENLPEMDQIYKVSINVPGVGKGSYDSSYFVFRNAFVKSRINAVANPFAKNICFISTYTGRVKCVGDNQHLATGYEVGIYNESHPYQLSFLPNISDVHDIAVNRFATCAIYDYNESTSFSSTKCWGTNKSGLLGVNNNNTEELFGDDYYAEYDPSIEDDLHIVNAANSIDVTQPDDTTSFKANSISSGANDFCTVNFSNKAYCWGPLAPTLSNSSNRTKPSLIEIQNGSNTITNITQLEVANNPNICVTGKIGSSNINYYCLKNTNFELEATISSNQKIAKIAPGQGYKCYLLSNSNDSFFGGNIRCEGSNNFARFGYGGTSTTSFVKVITNNITAIDLFAGRTFSCFIDNNYDLRCAGTNKGDLTNNSNQKNYNDRPIFDFGAGVKTIGGSVGDDIVCVTLEKEFYGEAQYAVKCWGDFQFSNSKYYLHSSYRNNNSVSKTALHKYHPVIRW